MRAWKITIGLLVGMSLGSDVRALSIAIDQTIPVPLPGSTVPPTNAEGIAVIQSGPRAGIYVPHRDSSLVTVLDVSSGAFLYNFNTGIVGGNLRAIDVLDNGNLLIGQHTSNYVREVVIPPNPQDSSTPTATFGTISFTVPAHPDDNQVFDEFEALSPFVRPSDGQQYVLLAEEGRNIPFGSSNEQAGEVYLGVVSSAGALVDFDKLFSVPLGAGYDDISGIDIVDIAFDGSGQIDFGASRVIIVDDSSGGSSGAWIMNLAGEIIETLAGPGNSTGETFETLFGQPWRDAEGVDFDAESGKLSIFFSTGGSGTPQLVVFNATLEVPPVPEPVSALLLGLGLAGLAVARRRR
jgi:hypothetical protein